MTEVGNNRAGTFPNDRSSAIHWLATPEAITIECLKYNAFGLLVLTGIVNPFGPTLSGLALLSDEPARNSSLIKFFLNPFRSAAERIAQFAITPPREQLVAEAIKHVERLGYDGNGCFTLLYRGDQLMDTRAHHLLAAALLARTEGVARKLPFLKRFPNNPWDRIRTEMDELSPSSKPRRPLLGRLGFSATDPKNRTPTSAELTEFMDIILNDDHRIAEEKAFFAAWDGAIRHYPEGRTQPGFMDFQTMTKFYVSLTHLDEISALRRAHDGRTVH
jgi:hypothetical protein